MAGKIFREAAKQNADLQKKYAWLKENTFLGKEYDTDLSYGKSYAYDGCKDADDSDASFGPFYISCNNDFVWDGTIKAL